MSFVNILKEHSLKATPQRLAVLKILDKHEHPTIEELYANIKTEYPSVSLATVYKNVNALKSAGVVVEVNMPNGKMRYDIYTHPHIHIVCNNCGHITDVPYSLELEEYQKYVEKNIKNIVSSLDVVAHVQECEKCLTK